ncbi:MAG: hypothetical protein QME45_09010 [Clostridiales bacterium]|nr:hypothetical protein [Clostridiales bacterium]
MIDIGLHFEIFSILSIIFLVAGAVLGYASRAVLSVFIKKPSDKAVLAAKLSGLILVIAGMLIIFTR